MIGALDMYSSTKKRVLHALKFGPVNCQCWLGSKSCYGCCLETVVANRQHEALIIKETYDQFMLGPFGKKSILSLKRTGRNFILPAFAYLMLALWAFFIICVFSDDNIFSF